MSTCFHHAVATTAYFKQYGPQRSGTNYLKRLLELNFENVVVFGSVLGWKHGLYETKNGNDSGSRSHEEWIEQNSERETVYSVDGHPLPFSREELEGSLASLNYLISTKNIYSWVLSFKRFRANRQDWAPGVVETWCQRFVDDHKRWADLLEAHGGCLIEYEQLVADFQTMLRLLERRFRLKRVSAAFMNEPRIVRASTDHGLLFARKPFEPGFYLDQSYLDHLPAPIRAVIDRYAPLQKVQLERMRKAAEMGTPGMPISETCV